VTDFGVVTGLAFEARLIEKAFAREWRRGPDFACAGPGPERARATAAQLVAGGAQVLVSFGLCAGLDPALKAGDLMLAEVVIVAPGLAIETDPPRRTALAARLSESGLRVVGGALLGQERQIGRAEDKAALFASTGARAVDMESHGVARAAEAAGVPFLVARAVADPAGRDLPRAALDAAGPDGRIKLFKVLTTMYLRPWEGPAVIRLAYEARLAVDTLERIAGPDGGLFGGD
jgi:adenosylhomocysteine nucleosidase